MNPVAPDDSSRRSILGNLFGQRLNSASVLQDLPAPERNELSSLLNSTLQDYGERFDHGKKCASLMSETVSDLDLDAGIGG